MSPEAIALAGALLSLLPPSSRDVRAGYVSDLAVAVQAAASEATCTGGWEAVPECRRRWPGGRVELEAFTGTLAFFESGLDPRIQAGSCRRDECDGVFVFRGVQLSRAATAWQIQGLWPERRREVVGLEPMVLYEAAREATRVASGARQQCVWDAYSGRASLPWDQCSYTRLSGATTFRQAGARARMFRRVLADVQGRLRA